jgi:predicted flap endonuclease-1-like 5' DNA nuclease
MVSSSFPPSSSDSSQAPSTNVLLGAASPLWAVFGGAAAAGAAWWWWSNRWREAVNLEALIAIAPEPVSRGVIDEPAPALVEAPVKVVEAVVAEVEPVVETVATAAAEVVEAAAEVPLAVAEASVEVVDAVVETVPEPLAEVVAEPEQVVEKAVAPLVETAKTAADDLTLLVGIGPKLAASLADLGVTRFGQIAAWSADELDSFDKLLNLKGRAERDAWIAQARRLADGA